MSKRRQKNLYFFPPISWTFILFKPHKFIPNWNSTCITNTLFEISSLIYTTLVLYVRKLLYSRFSVIFHKIWIYNGNINEFVSKSGTKNVQEKSFNKKLILKMSKKMFAIFMIAYNKFSKCGGFYACKMHKIVSL